MANRNFKRVQALQTEIKLIHAKISIGATGAPTLVKTNGDSLGVKSVTRNSAGNYTLVLDDKYVALVHADFKQLVVAIQDLTNQLVAESVSQDAKSVQFRCLEGDTATDPVSDSTIYVKLELKNSSAK